MEVLVAIGIVVLVLVGVSSLTSSSIKTSRISTEKVDASKLAQIQINTLEKTDSNFMVNNPTVDLEIDCVAISPTPTTNSVTYSCAAFVSRKGSNYTLKVKITWASDTTATPNTFELTKTYVR